MDSLWLTVYAVVVFGLGAWGVVWFEAGQRAPLSRTVGLAVTLGAGVLGFAMFGLELLFMRPDRSTFLVLLAFALVGLALAVWRRRSMQAQASGCRELGPFARLACVLMFVMLLGCLATATLKALGLGLSDWDSFAIWALKAKVVAAEGLVPRPAYFSDVSMSYSHLDYPLMVPLHMASVFAVLDRVDDQLAKLPEALLYLGLACLVFSFCRRRTSLPMALAVTVLVIGAPWTLRQAGSGMAEVQLMAFYTASVVYLVEWRETLRWRLCVLCGVMSAFAAFTKNEGLALGVINCVVMALFPSPRAPWRRLLAGAGLCALVFVLLVLPWMLWSHGIPRTHGDYLGNLSGATLMSNLARIPTVLGAFGKQIVTFEQHGLLWLVLLATAALRWRTFADSTIKLLWVLLVLHLSSYAMIFVVTPHDVVWHMASSLHRLVLHALPLGGMLVAMHLASSVDAVGGAAASAIAAPPAAPSP
ncbi:MAG: hypothetical protein ABIP94_23950 [Planctomycetota bacterium]